jgi:hypothetical protein
MNRLLFLKLWSFAVGAMDTCTGFMLIAVPGLTLRLMSVPAVGTEALAFLSWMGVFIAGVGLSYALVLRGNREGETVWIFTAIVRLLVAVFLTARITSGSFSNAWALVAATDAVVGIVQLILIRTGWWKGAEP